jgi:hypothetical protein
MQLSEDFARSVRKRATRDPVFRKALLAEIKRCFERGEAEAGLTMLKKYLPATANGMPAPNGTTTGG